MRKPTYKKMKNNIPTSMKTSTTDNFEVLWSDNLIDAGGKQLDGITRFEPNQILINKNQTDKNAVLTAVHEFFHGLDHSHEIGLTENQVLKLENCFPFIREFLKILEGK